MAGALADFADQAITEIACHGRGAFFLNNSVRTVLDIGGQDSKAISLDEQGSVIDFVMNDKCAAGTGRFLEVMAHLLGGEVQDLDRMAAGAEAQVITNMCTVFAESEVISLLARALPRNQSRGAYLNRSQAAQQRFWAECPGAADRLHRRRVTERGLKRIDRAEDGSEVVCVAARPDCRSPRCGNNRLELRCCAKA